MRLLWLLPLRSPLCAVVVLVLLFVTLFLCLPYPRQQQATLDSLEVLHLSSPPPPSNDKNNSHWKRNCHFHTCFEINDCRYGNKDQISVYVYPEYNYSPLDGRTAFGVEMSIEYQEILTTIQLSDYYEPSPSKACVFVPSVDTLNQQRRDVTLMSQLLQSMPWWNNGQNHLIFSMLPGEYPSYNSTPDLDYGRAMLAGSSMVVTSYRMNFDISIPIYNALTRTVYTSNELEASSRVNFLTVLSQLGSDPFLVHDFIRISQSSNERVILLGSCEHCQQCRSDSRCGLEKDRAVWKYPDVLKDSVFCLILPGYRKDTPDLLDVMMTGCIPVLLRSSQQVLPFSEVLDWDRGTVMMWREELPQILQVLRGFSGRVRKEKRKQIKFLYRRYFSTVESITLTTLKILNGRVFSLSVPSYEWWNNAPFDPSISDYFQRTFPLPLSLTPGRIGEGFTAVILTYDRILLLFETIRSVARAPSLSKILVLWNNMNLDPPPDEDFPAVGKPIKIIRSSQNKLSNRFCPYAEIETSAVLSLDDDITMMSADEIEFGYQTWTEYPQRIVGYPGRVHWFDITTNYWKYESEWMNNISVVLTGAAFYHKYYHYLYTNRLPHLVREWVDKHFNCEDIVFNFMVANYTGLPPIKVTPRKRFKCMNCTKDGLFTDLTHFEERNECINLFASFFNGVPLKATKFRLDPVLYRVADVEKSTMDFPNVGQL